MSELFRVDVYEREGLFHGELHLPVVPRIGEKIVFVSQYTISESRKIDTNKRVELRVYDVVHLVVEDLTNKKFYTDYIVYADYNRKE